MNLTELSDDTTDEHFFILLICRMNQIQIENCIIIGLVKRVQFFLNK